MTVNLLHEQSDRNRRAVFGEHISIYDIQKTVADKATVPILYESRLVKLNLKENMRPWLDERFDEVTEGEEQETREQLKSKWAALEALVGDDKRIRQIAQDILRHFELRQGALDGKGMIVCMSRRICLVVDYLGLAENLRQAMADYTANGGKGETHELIEQAVDVLMEKYDICRGILFGFDWLDWMSGTPQDRLTLLKDATDHVLGQRDGKAR